MNIETWLFLLKLRNTLRALPDTEGERVEILDRADDWLTWNLYEQDYSRRFENLRLQQGIGRDATLEDIIG